MYVLNTTGREAVAELPDKIIANKVKLTTFNCADIVQPFIKINDLDYEAIKRVMNVNFYGTLYMTNAFLP